MTRSIGTAAALLFIACVVSRAHASDLDVAWSAPAQVCPDREQLRAGLSRRLQREVSFGADASLALTGHIWIEGTAYVLDLSTRSDDGVEQRELRARTCNELARASVLIASLLFSRSGALVPAKEPEDSAPSDASSGGVYARAQLVGDLGTLPSPAFGLGLMVGMKLGEATFELGGFTLLPRDGTVAARAWPVASLQLTAAAASGCFELLHRPALSPCLHLEAGDLRATGMNLSRPARSSTLWLMAGAGLRAGFELTRWLHWSTDIAVGLPWDRTLFTIDDVGPVHRIPPAIMRVSTGLESHF